MAKKRGVKANNSSDKVISNLKSTSSSKEPLSRKIKAVPSAVIKKSVKKKVKSQSVVQTFGHSKLEQKLRHEKVHKQIDDAFKKITSFQQKKRDLEKETHTLHMNLIKHRFRKNITDFNKKTKGKLLHHQTFRERLKAMPLGVKVFLSYIFFLAVFNLAFFIFGFSQEYTDFFAHVIHSTTFQLSNLLFLVLLSLLIYSIVFKRYWTHILAAATLGIMIVDSLFLLFYMRSEYITIGYTLLKFFTFLLIYLNLISLWYVILKRNYFQGSYHLPRKSDHIDKMYVFAVFAFVLVFFIFVAQSAITFINSTSDVTEGLVKELNGKSLISSLEICRDKTGTEADLCYVVLVTVHSKESGVDSVCKMVNSDLYYFTCLQGAKSK